MDLKKILRESVMANSAEKLFKKVGAKDLSKGIMEKKESKAFEQLKTYLDENDDKWMKLSTKNPNQYFYRNRVDKSEIFCNLKDPTGYGFFSIHKD